MTMIPLMKYNWMWLLLLGTLSWNCQPEVNEGTANDTDESTTLTQLEWSALDFAEASDSIELIPAKGERPGYIQTASATSWLEFEWDIPQAGRYRVELFASSDSAEATAWLEDYIDNPDGRTYNLTGTMPIAENSTPAFIATVKEGSPLNAGKHKVKWHIKGKGVRIQKIRLTLLKSHRPSTQILTQSTEGEEWVVAWSDEFDREGHPDTSKWTYDIGDWGWGNGELQYYTEGKQANARVENGHLIIEARKGADISSWTSARLTTRGKVAFRYGRIAFRAKVPPNKGNWAAGWTLGNDYVDELSWPYCGEIDILESVGYEMDNATGKGKAHASAHCGAYYFKLGNQPTGVIELDNMNNEFHIYAVDWMPDGITAYVDGQPYFEYSDTSTELSWPFDKPQNLILNLAMGGGWGGLQGMDTTVSSQKMIVDYVRVYERK